MPSDFFKYMHGEIPFCSFNVDLEKHLTKSMLTKALKKGSDGADKAYCRHAAQKHSTFRLAAQALLKSLETGNFTFERSVAVSDLEKWSALNIRFLLKAPVDSGEYEGAYARAYFPDITTMAQNLTENVNEVDWPWRPKGKYIQRNFGNLCSTKIATLFVANEVERPSEYFKSKYSPIRITRSED